MKREWILVLLAVVLVISSCQGGRNRENLNWRTGSQGVYMTFATNSPPPRVYDDEKLNVVIELENRGATDIKGGSNRIYLSGFDPSIITGVSTRGVIMPDMEGKDQYNPYGDIGTLSFDANIRDLRSREIDKYEPTLLLTGCYAYETISDPMVCIDSDPFSRTAVRKVCTPSNVGAGSQAAPVSVSSVEVEGSKGRTKFKIYVKNVGGGTVIKDGWSYLDKCNPYHGNGLEYTDLDYVRVVEVKLGNTNIKTSCKPLDGDMLRLKTATGSGTGYMYCEATGLSGPAYTTPLRIKLAYNYRETLQKHITIYRTE